MNQPKEKFKPGAIYHVYNHGNAKDNVFLSEENCSYFLSKYVYYINPVANTIAYCLMPNHYHFAVKIKGEEELKDAILKHKQTSRGNQTSRVFKTREVYSSEAYCNEALSSDDLSKHVSAAFSNCFNSYAKAFNKVNNRVGSLFRENMHRKQINNSEYLINVIRYIHQNPIYHGFVKNADDWKFSSHNAYLADKKTMIHKEEVIGMFNGKKEFTMSNNKPFNQKYFLDLGY